MLTWWPLPALKRVPVSGWQAINGDYRLVPGRSRRPWDVRAAASLQSRNGRLPSGRKPQKRRARCTQTPHGRLPHTHATACVIKARIPLTERNHWVIRADSVNMESGLSASHRLQSWAPPCQGQPFWLWGCTRDTHSHRACGHRFGLPRWGVRIIRTLLHSATDPCVLTGQRPKMSGSLWCRAFLKRGTATWDLWLGVFSQTGCGCRG